MTTLAADLVALLKTLPLPEGSIVVKHEVSSNGADCLSIVHPDGRSVSVTLKDTVTAPTKTRKQIYGK